MIIVPAGSVGTERAEKNTRRTKGDEAWPGGQTCCFGKANCGCVAGICIRARGRIACSPSLGLDPATVAEIVGHDDGGYLIATVYTKLGRRRALERAQRAMKAYERRHTPPETPRRLHVVASA
jgi:hypothetical protein